MMKPPKKIKIKQNKLKLAEEELARQKHIIMNSFYGNFGAKFFNVFNSWNEQPNQENLSVKKLENNEICKKE